MMLNLRQLAFRVRNRLQRRPVPPSAAPSGEAASLAQRRSTGFTLVELMVSFAVFTIVMGAVMAAFVSGLQDYQREDIITELNNDLELSMEYIRRDLRLSSVGIGLMSFYPANASAYTAISFPQGGDANGDGLLDRDQDERILWQKTIIYHIRPGTPDELIRTVYEPRNTNSTPAHLYFQLTKVVASKNLTDLQAARMPGENVTTKTIFSNLVQLKFMPPFKQYDCYYTTERRDEPYPWGSVVLGPGMHKLRLKVVGKSSLSTGYKVFLDRFRLSLTGSSREGETYTPVQTHPLGSQFFRYTVSAGSVQARNMNSSEWSGNSQLVYTPTAIGDYIEFDVYNDLWCDNNFNEPGSTHYSNCTAKLQYTLMTNIAPNIPDRTVVPEKGNVWNTTISCEDNWDFTLTTNGVAQVRNFIYGSKTNMALIRNGNWVKVYFLRSATESLLIKEAKISALSGSPSANILFSGSNTKLISTNAPRMLASDWIPDFEIQKNKDYVVEFKTDPPVAGQAMGVATWQNTTTGDIMSQFWQGTGPWVNTNLIFGVMAIDAGYPTISSYRSGIMDTQLASPTYLTLNWTEWRPLGGWADIDVRVRSGNNADLSDCTEASWLLAYPSYAGAFQGSGSSLASLPKKRYFQYEAFLGSGVSGSGGTVGISPLTGTAYGNMHTNVVPPIGLRDLTIDWTSLTGLTDLTTECGQGPDGGLVEASVDGQAFVRGIVVSMEIFKQTNKKVGSTREIAKSKGMMEIQPLNTGK